MDVSRSVDKAKAQAEAALSELEMRQRVDDLKAEIASLTKTLSALGGQTAESYRDTVEKYASDAVNASLKAFDKARDEAVSLEESLERQVRDYPLRALGIAAGIGFLFALLSRR